MCVQRLLHATNAISEYVYTELVAFALHAPDASLKECVQDHFRSTQVLVPLKTDNGIPGTYQVPGMYLLVVRVGPISNGAVRTWYVNNERRNNMRFTLFIQVCTRSSAHPIWVRSWLCLIGPVHQLSVVK